jgi:hypothetical protein
MQHTHPERLFVRFFSANSRRNKVLKIVHRSSLKHLPLPAFCFTGFSGSSRYPDPEAIAGIAIRECRREARLTRYVVP